MAGYLARLTKIVQDSLDVACLSITVESSKDIRKALVDFEEEIDCKHGTNIFMEWIYNACNRSRGTHRVGFSEVSPVGDDNGVVFYCSG